LLGNLQDLACRKTLRAMRNSLATNQDGPMVYDDTKPPGFALTSERGPNDFDGGKAALHDPVSGPTGPNVEVGAALGDNGRKGRIRAFERLNMRAGSKPYLRTVR
jgi:hypothetical protein